MAVMDSRVSQRASVGVGELPMSGRFCCLSRFQKRQLRIPSSSGDYPPIFNSSQVRRGPGCHPCASLGAEGLCVLLWREGLPVGAQHTCQAEGQPGLDQTWLVSFSF